MEKNAPTAYQSAGAKSTPTFDASNAVAAAPFKKNVPFRTILAKSMLA